MSSDLFDRLESRPVWGDKEWGIAKASAHSLFNPSSAIDQERLFSGRIKQVEEMLGVIYERGAHACDREKELLMMVVSLASQAIEAGIDLDIMPPVEWKELYGEWAASIRDGMQ